MRRASDLLTLNGREFHFLVVTMKTDTGLEAESFGFASASSLSAARICIAAQRSKTAPNSKSCFPQKIFNLGLRRRFKSRQDTRFYQKVWVWASIWIGILSTTPPWRFFENMSTLLNSKVAFLTGGSTSIGLECARAYAAEGAHAPQ